MDSRRVNIIFYEVKDKLYCKIISNISKTNKFSICRKSDLRIYLLMMDLFGPTTFSFVYLEL